MLSLPREESARPPLAFAALPFSPLPPQRALPSPRATRLLLQALPSLLTLLGLLLGLLGLLLPLRPYGLLALGAGLACDLMDGAVARRLRVVTAWGAELDWHTDATLAAVTVGVLAVRLHPAWLALALPLAVVQATARRYDVRISGRAVVTAATVLALLLPRAS